ncbi:MAG: ABC transporter permease [Dehalococcoidia bacterium]
MVQEKAASPLDLGLEPHATERRVPGIIDILRRLVKEKPLGLVGGLIVVVIAVAAIGASFVPYGPNELGAGTRLVGPSLSHPFGTDNLGRDVFARVLNGARVSMWVGFLSVVTSIAISMVIGILSGYFGGWLDILLQRVVDAFIAFPGLIFLLAVIAIFKDSHAPFLPKEGIYSTQVILLVIAIGILLGVGASRIIRSSVLTVKGQTFIEASRSIGCGHGRMVWVHILPNVMAPVITLATLGFGTAILLEASLSFLGFGVPPNVPSWGGMLNREARAFMTQAPWLALAPGIALSLAVFGFNMLGDALRDLLDPRLRGAGGSQFR